MDDVKSINQSDVDDFALSGDYQIKTHARHGKQVWYSFQSRGGLRHWKHTHFYIFIKQQQQKKMFDTFTPFFFFILNCIISLYFFPRYI